MRSVLMCALVLGTWLGNATWASSPLDRKDMFRQLPISMGRSVTHVGTANAEDASVVLPGTPITVMRALSSLFAQDLMGPHTDRDAIGWGEIPGLGAFYLYRRHDLSAEFWERLASSFRIPALGKAQLPTIDGENLFYLRGKPENLWQTNEYTFRAAPVWMRCDFIIALSAVDQGTRVEIWQMASLLPGRRFGINSHTMQPTQLYDWRSAPYPTNKERHMLLDMIRNQWASLPAQGATPPWPQAIVERDVFRQRLSVLLASGKLRVEGAQTVSSPAEGNTLRISYQIINDDDEPLVFPAGTNLRQTIQVWRGIEPVSGQAGMRSPLSLWGLAYPQGWSQAIPPHAVLQAHEQVSVTDHMPLSELRPGTYRIHLSLRASTQAGTLEFSKHTEAGLSIDLAPGTSPAHSLAK